MQLVLVIVIGSLGLKVQLHIASWRTSFRQRKKEGNIPQQPTQGGMPCAACFIGQVCAMEFSISH
jgi:hypothetical protein